MPIKLLVVLDDLRYSDRSKLARELEAQAEKVSGQRVEVYLTDRPEWDHRHLKVVTSFEAWVAANSLCLHESDPVDVMWTKEIGLPYSSQEEALRMLPFLARALLNTHTAWTAASTPTADPVVALAGEEAKKLNIATQAHMAIELGMKCLGHLSEEAPVEFTHSLYKLVEPIREPYKRQVLDLLAPLREPDNSFIKWRTAAFYVDDEDEDIDDGDEIDVEHFQDIPQPTENYLRDIVIAAAEIGLLATGFATATFGHGTHYNVTEAQACAQTLRKTILSLTNSTP